MEIIVSCCPKSFLLTNKLSADTSNWDEGDKHIVASVAFFQLSKDKKLKILDFLHHR